MWSIFTILGLIGFLFCLFQVILEDLDETLQQYDGISTVHGRFYKLQSLYYLGVGNLTGYYKSAIKYLGCTPPQSLPLKEQQEHAKNLAISALVADGMFNFGELVLWKTITRI